MRRLREQIPPGGVQEGQGYLLAAPSLHPGILEEFVGPHPPSQGWRVLSWPRKQTQLGVFPRGSTQNIDRCFSFEWSPARPTNPWVVLFENVRDANCGIHSISLLISDSPGPRNSDISLVASLKDDAPPYILHTYLVHCAVPCLSPLSPL